MDASKQNVFHERLLAQRKRLTQEIESQAKSRREGVNHPHELSHLPTHPADQDGEGLDADLAVEKTLRDELRAVDEALERIRNEKFGDCQRCGQPIANERLDALPFTPYCLTCEREAEAGWAVEPRR